MNDHERGNTVAILNQPLYSAEGERCVLGSMMVRPDAVMDEARETLTAKDFFVPSHQIMFTALCELQDKGSAIDMPILSQHLKDKKQDEAVGGLGYVAEIMNSFTTHLNVGSYIEIVKSKSLLRKLQDACADIAQAIQDQQDSVPNILQLAEKKVYDVAAAADRGRSAEWAKDVAPQVARKILDTPANREVTGIQSSIRRLDETTTGWHPGVYVISARRGTGKTAFALFFALEAAKLQWDEELKNYKSPGHTVGVFSLEMRKDELVKRLISNEYGIDGLSLRNGNVGAQERLMLEDVAGGGFTYPIMMDDQFDITVAQMLSRARRWKRDHGLGMLVIDYAQLIKAPDEERQRGRTRQNECAAISRGIKRISKELDVPVLLLSQINKDGTTREAEDWENDADVVMRLDPGEDPGNPRARVLTFTKNRNGPEPIIPLVADLAHMRFSQVEDGRSPVHHSGQEGAEPERADWR